MQHFSLYNNTIFKLFQSAYMSHRHLPPPLLATRGKPHQNIEYFLFETFMSGFRRLSSVLTSRPKVLALTGLFIGRVIVY